MSAMIASKGSTSICVRSLHHSHIFQQSASMCQLQKNKPEENLPETRTHKGKLTNDKILESRLILFINSSIPVQHRRPELL